MISGSGRWLKGGRLWPVLVVVLAGLSFSGAASAEQGPASVFVTDFGNRAISVLGARDVADADREAAVRDLLQNGFDLEVLGRFSLGRHWRLASGEQRQNYLKLFGEYVLRTYPAKLGGYAGERLVVVSEQPMTNNKDFTVKSRIERPSGPPVLTTWRVRVTDSGPRIVDIVIEGVSMAVMQRDEFGSVLRKGGVEGLLELLRERIAGSTTTASAG